MNIKEIAKMAGVSIGTVDRVLHNRGGVSKKTEMLIQKIIQDNNFTPNLIARNLALRKAFTIIVIIPNTKRTPFWFQPTEGVFACAKEVEILSVKVEVLFYDQFDANDFELNLKKALEYKASGVIVVPSFLKPCMKWLKIYEKNKIPYSFLDIDIVNTGLKKLSFFGDNSFKSGYIAGKMFSLLLKTQQTRQAKKNIIVIEREYNASRFSNLYERVNGFTAYFKEDDEQVNIKKIVFDIDDHTLTSKQSLHSLITKDGEHVNGIFIPSERIEPIVKVLPKFKNKIIIAGYDLTERNKTLLQYDMIDFIIDQEAYLSGYESVKKMAEYLAKNTVPKTNYFSPNNIVFKEHLQELDSVEKTT